MEALTISAANLDVIEKNLGVVANELSGVVNNVNSVNNQVNKVEEKVASLNSEVKGLVKEIRETTIISNARQSIMYNNAEIEKKYGYFDKVRRNTESLLDALLNSNISRKAIINLREEILLSNPRYWLANALAALSSWLLDDKENTDLEVKNALAKDSTKTCLFFALVNLKLGRTSSSLNWLKKYLSEQSYLELDKDFIVVLDLVATGTFGDEAKKIVLDKIDGWYKNLNSDKQIKDNLVKTWKDFIKSFIQNDIKLTYLEIGSPEINIINNNVGLANAYLNFNNYLNKMIYTDKSNKKIDEILSDLIYEYENKEQIFQQDNLKNRLIIECNGDTAKASELFAKQQQAYSEKQDLLSLLTNVIIYKDAYKISNETQKIALSLIKDRIAEALNNLNGEINREAFNIVIDKFKTKTSDGTNYEEITKELETYLNNEFDSEDKDLIITLLIINIVGIIGIFITLNSKILSFILITILILGNIVLFYKLHRRNVARNNEKNKLKTSYSIIIEKILAQTIDYQNILNDGQQQYKALLEFLNRLRADDYLTNNNERNIEVGE